MSRVMLGASCPGPNVLAAYIDGQLAGAKAAAVHGHVASCEACLDVIAGALKATRPDSAAQKAKGSGAGRRRGRRWPSVTTVRVLTTFSVAAVLLSGWWAWRSGAGRSSRILPLRLATVGWSKVV